MTLSARKIKEIWNYKLTEGFSEGETFSIYIDSPFCISPFCKFCIYEPTLVKNKITSKLKDDYYSKILIKEIRDFGEILRLRQPDSAYFGGGTSSLMTVKQMKLVFEELQKYCDFRNIKEKHFEFNPLSATEEKMNLLIDWNFSHMTFGVQTFNVDVLKFNNRLGVPYKKIKSIVDFLENTNIKYNLDLMTFIYKDDVEEDIEILKKDLEIIKVLNPKKITIFPNYKKLPVLKFFKEKKEEVFEKIKRFRQAGSD